MKNNVTVFTYRTGSHTPENQIATMRRLHALCEAAGAKTTVGTDVHFEAERKGITFVFTLDER